MNLIRKGQTVIIDAAYGGNETGLIGNNLVEKDFNLLVSNYIGKRLKELNIPYYLLRETDKTLNSAERANLISSKYGTDNNILVISNRLKDSNDTGVEIVYGLRNSDTFAKKIYEELEKENIDVNRYYQLRDNTNTALDGEAIIRDTPNYETVVIKYGTIKNKIEVEQLKNNYQDYAEAIVKAIADYTGNKYTIPSTSADKYVVKKGDSLWKIANNYGIGVEELKKANNLTSNLLSVGQILKIPQPSSSTTYVVQNGDSLWKIANNYKISVDELKQANSLDSNLLSIGQILKIPGSTTYVVQKGDTLWKIANSYGIGVEELKKANNLSSNILNIGQILKIPK